MLVCVGVPLLLAHVVPEPGNAVPILPRMVHPVRASHGPPPLMSRAFVRDQVNCANQSESGPQLGQPSATGAASSAVFSSALLSRARLRLVSARSNGVWFLWIVLGPVLDGGVADESGA
jgi:hypothetical protein